jgi:hypothetical protein
MVVVREAFHYDCEFHQKTTHVVVHFPHATNHHRVVNTTLHETQKIIHTREGREQEPKSMWIKTHNKRKT